ncbi:restriction endonuclease subunit S [Aeromonas caviae]|uniref:restriction endonuclease subunit S n=1 Tax=Aeromonas caviae TaxID=648 RepID=UPI002B24148B|nr:restriction endonuclease subunit S [Aeromonas caviae]MEA9417490.1 restriction endonuclease subunit S [Aeromonas caviae]MEA9421444.1 restriction endonuclease subunit S [Aeromonas caviae]
MSENKKQQLVPRLRFPEFKNTAEWQSPTLGEVSEPVEERVGERKLTPVSISAGIGFVPQAEKFGRDISGSQYKLYTVVRDGDFVYNKGNSLKFPQGCVYDLQGWGEVAAPNVFICFRLKNGYENGFYRQCFERNVHGIQLRKHITSGARSNGLLNISKEAFYGVAIPVPSHAEQQKIADCLSSLDDLIAAETYKLDTLKTHKKGLMQQLFPREGETVPGLRFPEFRETGEWEKVSLQRVIEIASGQVDPTKPPYCDLPHVGGENIEAGTGKLLNLRTAKEDGVISGKYAFDEHDILYSKIRPALNKVAAPDISGVCSADVYPIRPCCEMLRREFLVYLLRSESFVKYATKHSGRGKIPKINREDLFAYDAMLPTPAEQEYIASFLSSLDERINLQSQKLEDLQNHKIGLMQQLFPALDEVDA